MNSITIGIDGNHLFIRNNHTHVAIGMLCAAALLVGQAIQHKARGARPPEAERLGPVVLRREGDDLIICDLAGRLLFVWPCRAAVEIGNAVMAKAHQLEEQVFAEELAFDQGLLQRLGLRLGLTTNPAIQQMAGREAAWNTTLRRAIHSSERLLQQQVGTPAVERNQPEWTTSQRTPSGVLLTSPRPTPTA